MLRDMFAKSVSTLKQAGAKLPIASEVAIPAKVVSVNSFHQPTLLDYEQATRELAVQLPQVPQLRSLLDALKNIPTIASGTAYGDVAGQWYSVTYPKAMTNATPAAVAEGRTGEITGRIIPRIQDMTFMRISRVTRDDFNNDHYCDLVGAGARDRAKAIVSLPWPLDSVWGFLCDAFYWIFWAGWAVSGWILNVLWDSFIQNQTDRIQEGVNSVIKDANDKINGQLVKIQEALNLRLGDLYNTWGIPQNMALTVAQIRNSTNHGFEFLSLGQTTIHWIAVGA